jgi:hypothetical protein
LSDLVDPVQPGPPQRQTRARRDRRQRHRRPKTDPHPKQLHDPERQRQRQIRDGKKAKLAQKWHQLRRDAVFRVQPVPLSVYQKIKNPRTPRERSQKQNRAETAPLKVPRVSQRFLPQDVAAVAPDPRPRRRQLRHQPGHPDRGLPGQQAKERREKERPRQRRDGVRGEAVRGEERRAPQSGRAVDQNRNDVQQTGGHDDREADGGEEDANVRGPHVQSGSAERRQHELPRQLPQRLGFRVSGVQRVLHVLEAADQPPVEAAQGRHGAVLVRQVQLQVRQSRQAEQHPQVDPRRREGVRLHDLQEGLQEQQTAGQPQDHAQEQKRVRAAQAQLRGLLQELLGQAAAEDPHERGPREDQAVLVQLLRVQRVVEELAQDAHKTAHGRKTLHVRFLLVRDVRPQLVQTAQAETHGTETVQVLVLFLRLHPEQYLQSPHKDQTSGTREGSDVHLSRVSVPVGQQRNIHRSYDHGARSETTKLNKIIFIDL